MHRMAFTQYSRELNQENPTAQMPICCARMGFMLHAYSNYWLLAHSTILFLHAIIRDSSTKLYISGLCYISTFPTYIYHVNNRHYRKSTTTSSVSLPYAYLHVSTNLYSQGCNECINCFISFFSRWLNFESL